VVPELLLVAVDLVGHLHHQLHLVEVQVDLEFRWQYLDHQHLTELGH
jgi:hypothetical protein